MLFPAIKLMLEEAGFQHESTCHRHRGIVLEELGLDAESLAEFEEDIRDTVWN